MTRITKQDALDAGLCSRGQSRFFRSHGLDFRAFWRDGITTEELVGIEDLNMNRAIAIAVKREKEAG